MKRKNNSTPSAIWSFGAGEPTAGMDLLRDQLGGALWYWNALVITERDRRRDVKTVEDTLPIESVEKARALRVQLTKDTKAARSKVERDRLRATHKIVVAALDGYDKVNEINRKANERVKDARKASQLHFGTYLLVEKAHQEAWMPKKGIEWHPPRIKHWSECAGLMRGGREVMAEGRLGAHIMNGIHASGLLMNTMLQIEWPNLERDDNQWAAGRSERRTKCRVVARIRAGSDANRKPLWVEFPVTIHRPLPADAMVKAGWLSCRFVGTKWKYELQLQIESAAFAATKPVGTHGTVAVDLCWRKRDDGIRVAYLCDAQGVRQEMLMPQDVLDDLNAADKSKGHADTVFDETRDRLADDLGGLILPPLHQRQFDSLRLWKSPQRLAVALAWWCEHRFVGYDDEAFASAWKGLQRWRHLYQYATGIRAKALARRKSYYQDLALRICQRYGTIVVGDFDMRATVELDKGAADMPQAVRHNRVASSPSEFRLALKSTARRLGAAVEIVDCSKATLTCAACGHEHDLDPFMVDFRCEGCQTPWDRGHNHCCNLLKRASGSVPPRTPQPLAPMIPEVRATPRAQVRVRDRSGKRRSKTVLKRLDLETTRAIGT